MVLHSWCNSFMSNLSTGAAMILRSISSLQLFKEVVVDPKDPRLKKFRDALGELASQLGGRIKAVELAGENIRIVFATKEVAEGVTKALRDRKIDVEEVSLLDEFFG